MAFDDLKKRVVGLQAQTGFEALKQRLGSSDNPEALEKRRFLQREAEAAQNEARELNSFGTILKDTALGTVSRLWNVVPDTYRGMREIQNNYVTKQKATANQFASEYAPLLQGQDLTMRSATSGAKAGFRFAGDAVEVIFAPLSAAIGAVLKANGGAQLVDKFGTVVADKSGITDSVAFQKFAMEHPNAGEDFNRLLNLATLGAAESNAKISPTTMAPRTLAQAQTVARKLVAPVRQAQGGAVAATAMQQGLRKLPVKGEGPDMTKIGVNEDYANYTPDAELPTIEFGPKAPASDLPTIQMEERFPSASDYLPKGMKYAQMDGAPVQSMDTPVVGGADSVTAPRISVKPQEGTGATQTRGLAESTARAVEEAESTFKDLPTYKVRPQQLEAALKFTDENPIEAMRVAREGTNAPQGLYPEDVYTAVKVRAVETGDIATIHELATRSKLLKVATTMGQRIQALDAGLSTDPVKIVKEVNERWRARLNDADKSVKTELLTIKDEIPKIKRADWKEFIQSIKC